MRNRFLLHTLTLVSAFLLTGCEDPYDKVSQEQEIAKDFTVFVTPYTRAQLNHDDYSVTWDQGDAIAVFDGTQWCELKAIESGSPARFSGDVVPGEQYIAVYPADRKINVSDEEISLDVPSEQRVSSVMPDPAKDLRLGLSRGRIIVMNAPLGYLSLSINADNITSIKLEGAKGETISGKMAVDLTVDGVTLSETLESNVELTLMPSEGETFKAGTYCCEIAPVYLAEGLVLTFKRTDGSISRRIFSKSVEVRSSSVTDLGMWDLSAPEIESVTTLSPSVKGGTATLRGSMSVVNFNPENVICGFEYKTASAEEWTSVTCGQAAIEFSYELAMESAEAHQFRAWASVNGSDRIIYGEVGEEFAPETLVLHLVFDENRYETGYNFLWDTWEWGTNSNSEKENLNSATYNYTFEGVDYPFTFWSYRPEATKGGYSLWVASGSKKVYGLSLSYTKDLATSQPAWMQLPGPGGLKLIEINATLYSAFKGTISPSVNEDGTAAGEPVATFTGKSSFPLTLNGTTAGTRYYFCTVNNQRPTLRNLTLTYVYTE